jgi:hypothetical protein
VMAQGRGGAGIGAAAGIGAGRLCVVVDPHAPPPHYERSVLAAVRPVPALAPLLWTAAGLVTTAGGQGAHLLEVAHSLGVPAVVQVDLEALLGCGSTRRAAGRSSPRSTAATAGSRSRRSPSVTTVTSPG